MTPPVRQFAAPPMVVAYWLLSVVAGAGLLASSSRTSSQQTLAPQTLDRYLTAAAGPDAKDIRVNAVYGSGHQGAWQFVAHLTWRSPDGTVHGGTSVLPQDAGRAATTSTFDDDRLAAEERRGWPLTELRSRLAHIREQSEPLALLELEIPAERSGSLTFCYSRRPPTATCRTTTRRRDAATFADTLTDEPPLEALSVQRQGKRVTR
jgi:hypothetical protein